MPEQSANIFRMPRCIPPAASARNQDDRDSTDSLSKRQESAAIRVTTETPREQCRRPTVKNSSGFMLPARISPQNVRFPTPDSGSAAVSFSIFGGFCVSHAGAFPPVPSPWTGMRLADGGKVLAAKYLSTLRKVLQNAAHHGRKSSNTPIADVRKTTPAAQGAPARNQGLNHKKIG